LYGAETWTLREADQKYMKILKCGAGEARRKSVGPHYRVRNEKVLQRVKDERNIVQTINLNW
jgi:hypothetical protein